MLEFGLVERIHLSVLIEREIAELEKDLAYWVTQDDSVISKGIERDLAMWGAMLVKVDKELPHRVK
jgi:hypothetical protein